MFLFITRVQPPAVSGAVPREGEVDGAKRPGKPSVPVVIVGNDHGLKGKITDKWGIFMDFPWPRLITGGHSVNILSPYHKISQDIYHKHVSSFNYVGELHITTSA